MRGTYYRWLFFAAGPLEAAITSKALGLLAPDDQRRMVGYGSFDDTIDALEATVDQASPFLCGDQFTAPDIYVGASIGWGIRIGVIPKRDAFAAYVARVTERPSFVRALQIDKALLAGPNPNQES